MGIRVPNKKLWKSIFPSEQTKSLIKSPLKGNFFSYEIITLLLKRNAATQAKKKENNH
jgi:hypothetical protein